MKIWQIKEISKDTYTTFSDELKLKMIGQQFAFPIKHYEEVRRWLIENMKYPYLIDEIKNPGDHAWIKFTSEEDAVAFKLRWG